jgi:hypothetical protein
MHPRELANMALAASSVADREGFNATAEALVMIAAAAWAMPSVTGHEPEVVSGPGLRCAGADTATTNVWSGKLLYV